MSYNQEFESGVVYYESESTDVCENESVLDDIGEYVLPPQNRGNNTNSNEPQPSTTPQRSPRQVIQDEYDEDHYTLARPTTCQTKSHGVLQNATLENKPTRKDGMFQNKSVKIAAVVIVCIVIVGGLVPLAVVLTHHKGIKYTHFSFGQ